MITGNIGADDAVVACLTHDEKYVIVSPNMNFIPEPVWGRVQLRRCSDGTFGYHDPIHWPQLWDPNKFPWYATMPRSPMDDGRDRPFFEPVDPARFLAVGGAGSTKLYIIAEDYRAEITPQLRNHMEKTDVYAKKPGVTEDLRWLRERLDQAYGLLAHPATLRDCVRMYADVQRSYRMMVGFFNWIDALDASKLQSLNAREDFMGAFVSQPSHVINLFRLGIPVWHFRQPRTLYDRTIILCWVPFTAPPSSLPSGSGVFSDGVAWDGLAGHQGHLRYIDSQVFDRGDVETTPVPTRYQRFAGRIPSAGSSSKGDPHLQGKLHHRRSSVNRSYLV